MMILTLLVSFCAIAGFGLVLWRSKVIATSRSAVHVALSGVSAMLDPELDDDAKEKAVRSAGFGLIGGAFQILWRFALALAAAAAPIFAADAIGLVSKDAVFGLMMRVDYIVIVSVLAIAITEVVRRRRKAPAQETQSANHYSETDRFAHNIAFAGPGVLKSASWVEDRFYKAPSPETQPIFVTSLARGGTTALLNAFHDIPELATHVYRDMPFLTAPTLWARLSGGNSRKVERHQRAHGDGLEIDLDSPEAFEEVLWKMFWPEKYKKAGIALWETDDRRPKAESFIAKHMGKVIRARNASAGAEGPARRYCSKNNANIARLDYLHSAFPGARIVIPLRQPATHAASLLRQHQNFLKQQADDDFVRRYMRDIGHFEFGLIHKPLMFPGFDPKAYDPATPDYWLNYWLCAFRHVQTSGDCIFVLQDDLRSAPQQTMSALCAELGIDAGDRRFDQYFHNKADVTDTSVFSAALLGEANQLYAELAAKSGNLKTA